MEGFIVFIVIAFIVVFFAAIWAAGAMIVVAFVAPIIMFIAEGFAGFFKMFQRKS